MSCCKHEPPLFTRNPPPWNGDNLNEIVSAIGAYRNPAHDKWVKGNLHVLCPYKNCEIDLCQVCGRISGGVGPLGCPCDLTRGWKSRYVEGMGKPFFDVKPKGRYKGKIERRRREMKEFNRQIERMKALFKE